MTFSLRLSRRQPRFCVRIVVAALFVFGCLSAKGVAGGWQAGFARVVITPQGPMFASGYAARDKPSDGKIPDLWAKAAALRDPEGHTALFLSMDLIGVPVQMARLITEHAARRHGLERSDVMITCSHTHCGPALDDMLSHMLPLSEDDWKKIKVYQADLNAKLTSLVDRAVADLKPARLSFGSGVCRFATNRRTPRGLGPYDHSVPVLRIASADGATLRGVVFGYACHNTTLSFYHWCGDYAGFAQAFLEERHPGAVALFFTGCGADQNPLPRRKLELAEKYGRMLAVAVEETIESKLKPIDGPLRTAFREIDLKFASVPTRSQVEQELQSSNRYVRIRANVLLEQIEKNGKLSPTYPYPVQVWRLGEGLTWVALGGEVVVDYALRLKRELGEDRTWVTGYANDVMAYIPSERVLEEGGYEGGTSMVYYQLPSPWKAGLEDQIVGTVKELVEATSKER